MALGVRCGSLDWHHEHTEPQRLRLVTCSRVSNRAQNPGCLWEFRQGMGMERDAGSWRLQMQKLAELSRVKSAEGPWWLWWPSVSSVAKAARAFCGVVPWGA